MVSDPHLRVLAILMLDAGLRPNCETLKLKWEDIDFVDDAINIRFSKTRSGIRRMPMSSRCKSELFRWKDQLGPNFSPHVLWKKAARMAGIEGVVIYSLRYVFASRLSAAGVSALFIAQMIWHSSSAIVPPYAKPIDEFKRAAIRKLESLQFEVVG